MNEERSDDNSCNSDDALSGTHFAEPPPAHRGFSVQTGGRDAIAGTAERIGRAAGSAHRQMRRGLELVRPAVSKGKTYAIEMAARRMQDEVAETRGDATQGLEEFSELAADGLMAVREGLRDAVLRSRVAARRMVSEHPAQSVTALAGFCIAFGATLYWYGSRRR